MGWYYGWKPYVPVAARRARALNKMEQLRKKGLDIQPVEIKGRNIARTFWGEAWCDHLEKFSDFANRLPRGRTYVRNGSVCHLEIKRGALKAMVSGSEIYNVHVKIKPLPKKKWKSVKDRCAGQIGSLLELLQGRLSESVMAVVTDRGKGLFPLPREISLKCDCPDWAVMCKHVAAVLYGVGARLDEKPELLFLLRGVDHEELISAEAGVVAAAAAAAGKKTRRRRITEGDLAEVFGIEMSEDKAPVAGKSVRRRKKKTTPGKRRVPHSSPQKKTAAVAGKRSSDMRAETGKKQGRRKRISSSTGQPAKITSPAASNVRTVTGRTVAKLRAKFSMSQSQFARLLGVSAPCVSNWERREGALNLQTRTLNAWRGAKAMTKREAWHKLDSR